MATAVTERVSCWTGSSDEELAHMQALNYDYGRQLAQRGFMVVAPVLRDLGNGWSHIRFPVGAVFGRSRADGGARGDPARQIAAGLRAWT